MGRAAPVQEQYRRLIKPRGRFPPEEEKRSSAGTRDPVKVGRTRLSQKSRDRQSLFEPRDPAKTSMFSSRHRGPHRGL